MTKPGDGENVIRFPALAREPEADGLPEKEGKVLSIECSHGVEFDSVAAAGLSSFEVRRRWPRKMNCEKCGFAGIIYASLEHYVAGDW